MPDPSDTTQSIAGRVARKLGDPELVDRLSDSISGSDLASLLLAVLGSRASAVTPTSLLERHDADRFVRPSPIDLRALLEVEHRMLSAIPSSYEAIQLAPLVPFGTHRALGKTPQNNVVTTSRQSEIAADPTAGLALEAAKQRQALLADDPKDASIVRLATIQRVTRGQPVEGPAQLRPLHTVRVGDRRARDVGNLAFEKESLLEHIQILCARPPWPLAWRAPQCP